MTHDKVHIADWVAKIVVGALLTGVLGWGAWTTRTNAAQDVKITAVEKDTSFNKENIAEIKASQTRIEMKLDAILIERKKEDK